MRRKDREVTDPIKIREIIDRCYCCRIGFCDGGEVYIVPMNFGYTLENDRYCFYFHSAGEGRKIDLIRQNPRVGFELDTDFKLHPADIACRCSARFQSVIGNGEISFVTDADEKKAGLLTIMRHLTGKSDWEFDENKFAAVTVFKLTVTELSCKEHL